MSDNWVVQNLENALETWNEKLSEIWTLITTTPQNFKGGGIWSVIVNINGAVQAIGLALLVLFFVVGMVKTCGSFSDVKKPEHALKLFIRFALAKGAITYGTQINYPVMQSPQEPNFYLKHGFDKEYTDYGCPYMSESCDVNKPSDNLIVYGHHMKNGTMFSDLEKFKSKEFWEEHKTFRFDTLYVKQTYEVIAVFKTAVYTGSENEFKYYQFVDAAVQEQFDGYIQRAKEKAFYDTGVSAEYGDKLITLSTCEYSGQNSRLVVVAKKVTESGGSNAPSNDGATEIQS